MWIDCETCHGSGCSDCGGSGGADWPDTDPDF